MNVIDIAFILVILMPAASFAWLWWDHFKRKDKVLNEQYVPNDLQIVHKDGCWSWGPRHYLCALREIRRLNEQIAGLREHLPDQNTKEDAHGTTSL